MEERGHKWADNLVVIKDQYLMSHYIYLIVDKFTRHDEVILSTPGHLGLLEHILSMFTAIGLCDEKSRNKIMVGKRIRTEVVLSKKERNRR